MKIIQMRKFNIYAAVACISAIAFTAGAADFGSTVSADSRFQSQDKSLSEVGIPKTPVLKKAQTKATRDEVCGYYNFDSYRLTRAVQGWERTYCMPVVASGEGDDDLILYGFWADFDYDGTPISAVEAKFDYEKQQIIIPAGASLGTYGEYSAYIYVSDWNTDRMLDEPIILNYDAENKGMTYYCEPQPSGDRPVSCLIVTSYPDAVGKVIDQGVDFIAAIEMYKYNGTMTLTDVTHSSDGQSLLYIDTAEDSFTVRNFGNRGFRTSIKFNVNYTAGTCTAQPTLCHEDFKFDDGNVMDLHYAGTDGGPITGTLEKRADSDMYDVHIPSWTLYNVKEGKAKVEFRDSYLSVPLKGNSSVDSVMTDDPDAPVEYYTLQGIRIADPEKGSLVIRRQGQNVRLFRF